MSGPKRGLMKGQYTDSDLVKEIFDYFPHYHYLIIKQQLAVSDKPSSSLQAADGLKAKLISSIELLYTKPTLYISREFGKDTLKDGVWYNTILHFK
jgi:hypothetical protein